MFFRGFPETNEKITENRSKKHICRIPSIIRYTVCNVLCGDVTFQNKGIAYHKIYRLEFKDHPFQMMLHILLTMSLKLWRPASEMVGHNRIGEKIELFVWSVHVNMANKESWWQHEIPCLMKIRVVKRTWIAILSEMFCIFDIILCMWTCVRYKTTAQDFEITERQK